MVRTGQGEVPERDLVHGAAGRAQKQRAAVKPAPFDQQRRNPDLRRGQQHDEDHPRDIFRRRGRGDGEGRQRPVGPASLAHTRQHAHQQRRGHHDGKGPEHQHAGQLQPTAEDVRHFVGRTRWNSPDRPATGRQNRSASAGSCPRAKQGPAPVAGDRVLAQPARHHAQPFAIAHDQRPAVAVAVEPGHDLRQYLIRRRHRRRSISRGSDAQVVEKATQRTTAKRRQAITRELARK